jgi:CxxC motif-containing protein (DUF1111 family)
MAAWRIYYADGSVVEGTSAEEWRAAPVFGVQVVACMEAGPAPRWTWTDVYGRNRAVRDRQLWTGEDDFDPFGWGVKHGQLIPDENYWRIWRRACTD